MDHRKLRAGDLVAPIQNKVKAINQKMTIGLETVLVVVKKWFDRKKREFVILVKGGMKFFARDFRRVGSSLPRNPRRTRAHKMNDLRARWTRRMHPASAEW